MLATPRGLALLPKNLLGHAWGFLALRQCLAMRLVSKAFRAVADSCPAMWPRNIRLSARLAERSRKSLLVFAPRVRCVQLDSTNKTSEGELLRGLDLVLEQLPALEVLELGAAGGCPKWSDEALARVASSTAASPRGNLQQLGFDHCRKLTSAGLHALLANASLADRLTSLSFAGCPQVRDPEVALLAARCPQLASVYLSHTAVSDSGLAALACCAQLTSVDLTGTAVSDGGLLSLARGPSGPRLERLACPNVLSSTGFALLAAGDVWPRLTVLKLGGLVDAVYDSETLAHSWTRTGLRHWETGFCPSDSNVLPAAVFSASSRLEVVVLRHSQVLNVTLGSLVQGPSARTLTRLDISYCPCLTARAVTRAVAKLPRLALLNLQHNSYAPQVLTSLAASLGPARPLPKRAVRFGSLTCLY